MVNMKKYIVFELFLLQINDLKFICKYDSITHKYIEVLTDEEITEPENIESLAKYYSLYDLYVNKQQTLTKRQILMKYIEINQLESKSLNSENTSSKYYSRFADMYEEYVEPYKKNIDIPIISSKEYKGYSK